MSRLRDHRPANAGNAPHAQNAVGRCVRDHLHKAIGLVIGFRAAVGHHRELADINGFLVAARLLNRFFSGEADAGNLWHCVNDARDHGMVHNAGFASDVLSNRNAFILGLMGEHGAGHAIANRPDAGHRGAEIVINLDLAALIGGKADSLKPKPVCIGPPSDRHQHAIGIHSLSIAASGWLQRQRGFFALNGNACDLGR